MVIPPLIALEPTFSLTGPNESLWPHCRVSFSGFFRVLIIIITFGRMLEIIVMFIINIIISGITSISIHHNRRYGTRMFKIS